MENKQSHHGFSGKIGYIMAVAGSAVGLGNIWRFPYLAAKYGGGIFLLVYLVLVMTFGYALIVTESAMGRMTGKGPVGAYRSFGKSRWFSLGGWINAIAPMVIVPYYCVIGGWVAKYLYEYMRGNSTALADSNYFGSFIASSGSVELWFVVFALAVFFVITGGVRGGVEKISKIMMPLLVLLAIIVAIYSISRPGAMAGVKYFLVPNFKDFSIMTIVAAMGQMFYSLSLAMGILVTYGSYIQKDVDIEKTTKQIEIFDTGIAILAGLMIIPAVFAFSGGDAAALGAGPSLMFITIPKVFESMGMSNLIGFVFFLMVLFAAITSAVSLMETCVSTVMEQTGWKRSSSSILVLGEMLIIGSAAAFGFGIWSFIAPMGMSILDFLDFISNSVLMPIAALCTCILVVRAITFQRIAKEVKISSSFKQEKLYRFVVKYFAPACIAIILVSSVANAFGIIKM